jgi:hypothetical protein
MGLLLTRATAAPAHAPRWARAIASRLRRTSSSSVVQLDTEIRIAAAPRQVVPLG